MNYRLQSHTKLSQDLQHEIRFVTTYKSQFTYKSHYTHEHENINHVLTAKHLLYTIGTNRVAMTSWRKFLERASGEVDPHNKSIT
jgi:hypothetical protein